jgi:hypothetical protein
LDEWSYGIAWARKKGQLRLSLRVLVPDRALRVVAGGFTMILTFFEIIPPHN